MANVMAKVAELLGVELGERFKLRRVSNLVHDVPNKYDFELTEKFGLRVYECRPDAIDSDDYPLENILRGEYEVVKLPYEPNFGDRYYFPSVSGRSVRDMPWNGETIDCTLKALGMVYRTKKEAEEHFASDYERLTGERVI